MTADIHSHKIIQRAFNHEDNKIFESLFSIGNGYMGMRGNLEENYSGGTLKGTYIGGIWVPEKTRVGWWKNGYPKYMGKVPNAPSFHGMSIIVNGTPVDFNRCEIIDFYRELDLLNGIVKKTCTIDAGACVLNIESEYFLSVYDRTVYASQYKAGIIKGEADVVLRSYLDGGIYNSDSEHRLWEVTGVNAEQGWINCRTYANDFGIERFGAAFAMKNTGTVTGKKNAGDNRVYEDFSFGGKKSVTINKFCSVITSRETEKDKTVKPGDTLAIINTAVNKLSDIDSRSYTLYKDAQNRIWADRFSKCDINIEGDDAAQQGIRFNIFQLLSTYDGLDAGLNIGPKGFTGEKYSGATMWDTEAFCLPFYLLTCDKEVPLQLLHYRYNQRKEAEKNARDIGLKGMLFPMVTFNGLECHNEWEITFMEIHRNAAIVHAIYNYTNLTGDESYIKEYGHEIITGVARFWQSRVSVLNNGKYGILGVTGPNEYENNVNNNFCTNYLAAWCLNYAAETIVKYGLIHDSKEIEEWIKISANMYLPYDGEKNIYLQQDGFLDKEIVPVSCLDKGSRPINKNWSWDRILRSCYVKQADVLQALFYFPDKFSTEQIRSNYNFYEPITVHESSLSPSIHSILASRIGKKEDAYRLYRRSARLDLDNINADTDDGLHITSMTGSWMSIVFGFAGLSYSADKLYINPYCPGEWKNYSFNIVYKERVINICVNHEKAVISLRKGDSVEIHIKDKKYILNDKIEVKTI